MFEKTVKWLSDSDVDKMSTGFWWRWNQILQFVVGRWTFVIVTLLVLATVVRMFGLQHTESLGFLACFWAAASFTQRSGCLVSVKKVSDVSLDVFLLEAALFPPWKSLSVPQHIKNISDLNRLHKPAEPQIYPVMSYNGATVLSSGGIYSSKAAQSYGNILLWGILVV